MTPSNQYRPDYAVPPGWLLEERLTAKGISHAEFARRCDRSAKLISEIISGKAPIEPKTALQFERVLGVDASIWLGIEADYRLRQTREAEEKVSQLAAAWSQTFPLAQLAQRGAIGKPSSKGEAVKELLSFFGVASIEAWDRRYGMSHVAYRHSVSFQSNEFSLASWRRLAEIYAEMQPCQEYTQSAFRDALGPIRTLTREPVEEAVEGAQAHCNSAGVALALVKPLPQARLSGAAWWISSRRPVIALSARHKTGDHLWFSFFHEAAHLLLHGKKDVFVDGANYDAEDIEAEANNWASAFLVPKSDWRGFVAKKAYSDADVREFAFEQGIAPGIVVGRLQFEERIAWSSGLNKLKQRFKWNDE
ncbi:MAG: HigA family addiction module antitoxin [Gemmatimonadota bacterium]|nr:HigA family addiction module antitoxin [Gemmatimonadota bacterium]